MIYSIYFSPGGTTKKTLRNILKGMEEIKVIEIDMTIYENRHKKYNFKANDIVLFGILTGTKMYGPVEEILNAIQGDNTPLIGVVTYGNGFYGSALKDMQKYIKERGFIMVAAGAFIGQYSFTDEIAKGRPDSKDENIQVEFGKKCYEKIVIRKDLSFNEKLKINWPDEGLKSLVKAAVIMNLPRKGMTMPKKWNDRSINEKCIACRKCERHCPMKAINIDNKSVDIMKCIGCNGCTNVCPTGAIQSTSPTIKKMVAAKIAKNGPRKEPILFY